MSVQIYSLATQRALQVGTNFTVAEFRCPDGSDKVLIDDTLVLQLQQIRDFFGRPVLIGSGYRTESYNTRINGADGSWHTRGRAADIDVGSVKDQIDPRLVCMFAETLAPRPGGLGLYVYADGTSWVHIDTGTAGKYWTSTVKGAAYKYVDSFLPVLRKQSLIYTNRYEATICQTMLAKLGLYKAKVDGKYGKASAAAVAKFQAAHKLTVDGICGPKTWAALFRTVKTW